MLPEASTSTVQRIMGCCGSRSYDKALTPEDKYYFDFYKNMPDLAGKTIAITGTTSGTGLQLAIGAVKKNAVVILLNRPSERSDAALKIVQEQASEPNNVRSVSCDLSSFDSVRQAAAIILADYEHIDVLANNAGVMAFPDEATEDSFDIQIQTNHLSHFLLTNLLFPRLVTASEIHGEARIVNHSSLARNGGKLKEQYFSKHSGGNLGGNGAAMIGCCGSGARWTRYHHSKLANSVFTQALHRRLERNDNYSNILCCCAAPGYAATQLQVSAHRAGGFVNCLDVWTTRFAQSIPDGTMPIMHACFAPNVKSGELWEPSNGMGGLPVATALKPVEVDGESCEGLWNWSEVATNIKWDL